MSVAKVLFVADTHLPASVDAVDELTDYLDASLNGATELYLLGDIFNYAVGLKPFRTSALDRLLQYLDGVTDSGRRVGYVGGNRDFFLDAVLDRHPAISYTEDAMEVRPFDVAVHLVHGDTLNPDDRQYLRWRRISRSAPVRSLASLLPSAAARWLGDRLERGMRTTNQGYRSHFPEAAVRTYGEQVIRRGIRLVLLGHFHDPQTLQVATGERRGEIHVVPGWVDHRTHSELDETGRFVLDVRHRHDGT